MTASSCCGVFLLRRISLGGFGGLEAFYAGDDVGYGAEGVEGGVGDFYGEELFYLEGEVDLVEGVDLELVEGGGGGDGGGVEGF